MVQNKLNLLFIINDMNLLSTVSYVIKNFED
jgi:hypothetical protein